jgi:hypothetical protein
MIRMCNTCKEGQFDEKRERERERERERDVFKYLNLNKFQMFKLGAGLHNKYDKTGYNVRSYKILKRLIR